MSSITPPLTLEVAIACGNHRTRWRQQLHMFELIRASVIERPEHCALTPAHASLYRIALPPVPSTAPYRGEGRQCGFRGEPFSALEKGCRVVLYFRYPPRRAQPTCNANLPLLPLIYT